MTKKKKKVAKKAPAKKKTAKKKVAKKVAKKTAAKKKTTKKTATKTRRTGRPPLPSNVVLKVKGQVRMTEADWAKFQKAAKADNFDGFSPWALGVLQSVVS